MASSSHNGALVFGLLLGVAGGAAWAIWNATESGEKLRADGRAKIEAALSRNHEAAPLTHVRVAEADLSQPLPGEDILVNGALPIESTVLAQ